MKLSDVEEENRNKIDELSAELDDVVEKFYDARYDNDLRKMLRYSGSIETCGSALWSAIYSASTGREQ